MASLKECRVRARKIGKTVSVIPERSKARSKYKYKMNGYHAKDINDLSAAITRDGREQKITEMHRNISYRGHRPKYGYKTVPRKRG